MRYLLSLLVLAATLAARPAPAQGPPPAPHAETIARAAELLKESASQNNKDHTLALRLAREALALWQTTDDVAGVASAYTQLGRTHYAQYDTDEAIRNFEEALRLWEQLGDARGQARALTFLSWAAARRGEWAGAISFLTRAEALVTEETDPESAGRIVSTMAFIFNEGGMPERGLEHYLRTLELYRRAQKKDLSQTLLAVGDTYRQLGKYPEALEHLTQALDGAEPESITAAQCHQYLGMVFVSLRDAPSALRHLHTALTIYTGESNPKEAAQVLALIGRAHELEGHEELGRRHYRRALEEFTRLADRVNEAAVLYALGASELRAGDYGAAETSLRRSLEVTENIRRVPTSRDLTAAFSATVHERYEKYIECLMRRHEAEPGRGYDARAYETSELARARALAETLRATQTSLVEGLDPALAAREKSLRQALRAREEQRVTLLGAGRKPELEALDAELARLDAEYREVAEAIRARHPAFERVTRPTAWEVRRIQEEVVADPETVLLEYSLGETRGYVWAVTRERFVSRELPPRERVDAAAAEVYNLLSAPPDASNAAALDAAARELSRLVLAPVAGELTKKSRVIVVADGSLHYIPFQMLPAEATAGEPLVASAEVVNAPSASVLGELREEAARRRPAARTLAAFGDPVFQSNYAQRREAGRGRELAAALPHDAALLRRNLRDIELSGDAFNPATLRELFYARRELAHLSEVAGGALVASGFDASRERLLGADLSQYAVIHFATHGFLNPDHPEDSGLMLSTVDADGRARDGLVTLGNVYALRAPVDLVVLSACRTALGKGVRGEGLLGLTRGFMYAGASGVVSSLWRVDDEATAELMRQFYTNLLRGEMTPAAALRAAQNEVRRRPEWRAPYYWAAFTLQGEHRQVIRLRPAEASSGRAWWAGGAALALAACGAAWLLRRRASFIRR
jgi:CHAT domain-containing protein